MIRRRHHRFISLVMVGILLFSALGFNACAQQAPTTPTTEPVPAVTEEKTAPPEEEIVTEEESTPTPESTPEQEPAPQQEPASIEVDISGFSFVSPAVTVPVGTTITWTNMDSVAHTVSSRDNLFDSGNRSRGATFSYTFTQSGTFQYYCKIHPSMTGEVIVVEE